MKTERETYPRSTCCIPGCARWSRRYRPRESWICGRHWRSARPLLKRALRRCWRRERDVWSFSEPTEQQRGERKRLRRIGHTLWKRMVASVITREAGL